MIQTWMFIEIGSIYITGDVGVDSISHGHSGWNSVRGIQGELAHKLGQDLQQLRQVLSIHHRFPRRLLHRLRPPPPPHHALHHLPLLSPSPMRLADLDHALPVTHVLVLLSL